MAITHRVRLTEEQRTDLIALTRRGEAIARQPLSGHGIITRLEHSG